MAAEGAIPPDAEAQRGFLAFQVAGPIAFSVVGVLAELAGVLAAAGVPILALSTFDTDVLLIAEERAGAATEAIVAAGWTVE